MTEAMKLKNAGMVLSDAQLDTVAGLIYAQTKWRFAGVADAVREGAEKLLKA